MAMDCDGGGGGEVVENLAPLFYVYGDGRVERLKGTDTVPPSVDPATSVASKDVTIVSATGVFARLYLPPPPAPPEKLPVVVYFHGGAFCLESAASPTYHRYLNSLAAAARVLCVSVEYRLAPEHPLPAAYQDSWAALSWVAAQASGATPAAPPEPWLSEHGDFTRVFLAGDSCGANIAHNIAMRVAVETLSSGVEIDGLVAVHPYFWFRPASGPSFAGPEGALTAWNERLWRQVYPSAASGVEEPCLNPAAAGAPSMAALACRRVLVCLAEKDFLLEQGACYLEALQKSGFPGPVELFHVSGEEHIFHLAKPGAAAAAEMMDRLVAFLHGRPSSP